MVLSLLIIISVTDDYHFSDDRLMYQFAVDYDRPCLLLDVLHQSTYNDSNFNSPPFWEANQQSKSQEMPHTSSIPATRQKCKAYIFSKKLSPTNIIMM